MQQRNHHRPEGERLRYGTDELYRFLLWVSVILALLRLIARGIFGQILLASILLIMGWCIFRTLSCNHAARRAENRAYLRMRRRLGQFVRLQYRRVTDRESAFRVCPECRAVLRMHRQSGEREVVCPRCGHRFEIHIR